MTIPTNRTVNTSAADHVNDQNAMAAICNGSVQSYIEIYHSANFTNSGYPPWTNTDLVKKTGTALDFIDETVDFGSYLITVLEDGLYIIESNWVILQGNNGDASAQMATSHYGPGPAFNNADNPRISQRSVSNKVIGNTWYLSHTTFFTAVPGDFFAIQIGVTSGTLSYEQTRMSVAKAI